MNWLSLQRRRELTRRYDRQYFIARLSDFTARVQAWSLYSTYVGQVAGNSGTKRRLLSCRAAKHVQTMREFQFPEPSHTCVFQLSGLFNNAVS
jgi:hypothetical protein